ncbi:unnamed protein product, partial [Mesorhabditis spiculigera]
MESTFRSLMKWHGKRVRDFKLIQGDFLAQDHLQLITEEATIIFINNFAFTADLDKKIKDAIIKNCAPGTKIISTKAYAKSKAVPELRERDLNDLSMMLDVTSLRTVNAPASWTGGHVPYYLHVVNPAKIERYFEYKNKKNSSTPSLDERRSNSSKTSQRKKPTSAEPDNKKAPATKTKAKKRLNESQSKNGKAQKRKRG